MTVPAHQSWLPGALPVAVSYPIIGVVFAILGAPAATGHVRAWRLAAWILSAAVFVIHLAYERIRLASSPTAASLHAAVSVAVGAFLLAVWVLVHGRWATTTPQSPMAPLALVVFPLVTGVPAFLAGLVLSRLVGGREPR